MAARLQRAEEAVALLVEDLCDLIRLAGEAGREGLGARHQLAADIAAKSRQAALDLVGAEHDGIRALVKTAGDAVHGLVRPGLDLAGAHHKRVRALIEAAGDAGGGVVGLGFDLGDMCGERRDDLVREGVDLAFKRTEQLGAAVADDARELERAQGQRVAEHLGAAVEARLDAAEQAFERGGDLASARLQCFGERRRAIDHRFLERIGLVDEDALEVLELLAEAGSALGDRLGKPHRVVRERLVDLAAVRGDRLDDIAAGMGELFGRRGRLLHQGGAEILDLAAKTDARLTRAVGNQAGEAFAGDAEGLVRLGDAGRDQVRQRDAALDEARFQSLGLRFQRVLDGGDNAIEIAGQRFPVAFKQARKPRRATIEVAFDEIGLFKQRVAEDVGGGRQAL